MEKEDTQGQIKRPHIPNSKYSEQQGQTGKASKKKVDNKKGGASKYKHQEGEKQEEGHDRLSKIKTEGVFCQAEAWRAACLATSATAMVRNLLLGTFDLETLLKSNLNGTKQHVPNLFCP
ncbi:hypothetical protein ROHU_009108 [Labeo rohita]|uniref:Uncharacterized protein n=1 Tax=Labeo rohita TaxID=84645 RepID=A0A498M1Q9_LABRO|nr:hypothetical protein ROHU_009108 [Labeo rohita]